MSRYDAVIVGGGLNSLVAAACLARAGKRVRLLERRDRLGGSLATESIAPGFRGPGLLPTVELFHPRLRRELELEAHGLKLLRPRGGTLLLRPDGPARHLRGGARIAAAEGRLSIADAAALLDLDGRLRRLSRVLERLWTSPLPRLHPLRPGGALQLLGHAWRLRRLGAEELGEALRLLPMSLQDLLDERFEDDGLKAALAAPGLRATWLGPRSAGSVYSLLHHRPAWAGGLLAGPVFAEGGPGALTGAVAGAARAAGAELDTEREVTSLAVVGGRAHGVVTADGATIEAAAVVSGLDPRNTLLRLADAAWLEPETTEQLLHLRCRGTASLVSFALEAAPRFAKGAEELSGRLQIGASLDDLERAFDAVKYGEIPERPWLDITIPTLSDPTLAPAGKQVMSVWVQYTPHRLRSGGWEESRDRLGDLVTETLEQYAPGFASLIRERRVTTPFDIERELGLGGGCVDHVEMALDQLLYMRPLPGWYRYRTPIDRLYLCGPGTHPGGGASGLSGRNAARQLLRDVPWKG